MKPGPVPGPEAPTEAQEVPSEHQETSSLSVTVLAQGAQGGHRVSILGTVQKLSGHGPDHPALADPLVSTRVGSRERPLPTSPVLWS